MIVNAAYFLTEAPVPEKADVDYVDPYYPTFYGFVREKDYYRDLNLQPGDFGPGKTPSRDDPKGSPDWPFRDQRGSR